jgi:hypothetical protein
MFLFSITNCRLARAAGVGKTAHGVPRYLILAWAAKQAVKLLGRLRGPFTRLGLNWPIRATAPAVMRHHLESSGTANSF